MSGEDDGESSNSEFLDLNENGDIIDNEDDSELSKQLEERKKLRALKLGFEAQKEIVYNKQLPYSGKQSQTLKHRPQFGVFRKNRPRIDEMVCRYKSQSRASHRAERAEAGAGDLGIASQQVHQALRSEVPQGGSHHPHQDSHELHHQSR